MTKRVHEIQRNIDKRHIEYEELNDENMLAYFKGTNSMKNITIKVQTILANAGVKPYVASSILRKMFPLLVPVGVKAKIKGDLFNSIVEVELRNALDKIGRRGSSLSLQLEAKCEHLQEIPDWTITNIKTERKLVGYNQIDLWSGGHQISRGGKYILDESFHHRLKRQGITIICVVSKRMPKLHDEPQSKMQKIIHVGLEKNRICYPKNLFTIVRQFC